MQNCLSVYGLHIIRTLFEQATSAKVDLPGRTRCALNFTNRVVELLRIWLAQIVKALATPTLVHSCVQEVRGSNPQSMQARLCHTSFWCR